MKTKTIFCFVIPAFLVAGMLFSATANKNVRLADAENDKTPDAEAYWSSISKSSIDVGGETLMDALKTKISTNVTTISYSGLWDAYEKTDIVPGTTTKIWDMYGGFQFTFKTDQAGSYSKEGDVYNREHSVPKSWFKEASPMYSDIVHLVPTDGKVNGMRSNYAFGEVSSVTYSYSFPARNDGNGNQIQSAGASRLGTPKTINGVSIKSGETKVFEPDDQYKGDFARIYMYFATRYQGVAINGSGGAMFSNSYPYMTSYGKELMKKWHEQDPVSQKELDRNDGIEITQGNRNPFVDHPEWANSIFGSDYTPTEGEISSVAITDTLRIMKVGDYHYFTSKINPSSASQNVRWESNDEDVIYITEGGEATALAKGSAILTCYSVEKPSLSASITVTVTDPSEVPLSGDTTVVLEEDDFPISYQEKDISKDGAVFTVNDVANYGQGIQFKSSSGLLFNKNSLGSIEKVSITEKANKTHTNLKIGFGNSAVEAQTAAAQGVAISKSGVEGNGKSFFCLKNGDGASFVATIEVKYTSGGSSTVEPAKLSTIEVNQPTTSYFVGDTFVKPTIVAYYDDGSSKTVTSLATFSGYNMSAVGNQTITVSYTEDNITKTTQYQIEVKEKVIPVVDEVVSVSLDKTSLTLDEGGDPVKLNATVKVNGNPQYTLSWNSSNEEVASVSKDGLVTPLSNGTSTITVFADQQTATCQVIVNKKAEPVNPDPVTPEPDNPDPATPDPVEPEPEEPTKTVDRIVVSGFEKLSYLVGQDLDISDLKVLIYYTDGTFDAAGANQITINGYDKNKTGTQTVTISAAGKSVEFTVVVSSYMTGVLTITAPAKTEYKVGEKLDLTGFKAEANYQDGTTKDVTENVVLDEVNMNKEGVRTIVVSYTENGVVAKGLFTIKITASSELLGCSGSVIASSAIISLTSLLGLGLLLLKKKQ